MSILIFVTALHVGVLPGHIPGSYNVPFMDCLDPETRRLKSPEQLRKLFQEAGVDLKKPIITTCGSGSVVKQPDFLSQGSYLLRTRIIEGFSTQLYLHILIVTNN